MPRTSNDVFYMGWDCGKKKGGISVINDLKQVVEYHQYPDNYYDTAQIIRVMNDKYLNLQAVIEKVWPFPKTAKKVAFSMGGSLASAETMLTVFGIPYKLVAGVTWQKSLKLPARAGGELDNKDHKERLRKEAQKMYPKCAVWKDTKEKQLAVCDSMLIAAHCRVLHLGEK